MDFAVCGPSFPYLTISNCSNYISYSSLAFISLTIFSTIQFFRIWPSHHQKLIFISLILTSSLRALRYTLLAFNWTNSYLHLILYHLPFLSSLLSLYWLFLHWQQTYVLFKVNQKGKGIKTAFQFDRFNGTFFNTVCSLGALSLIVVWALPDTQSAPTIKFMYFAVTSALAFYSYRAYLHYKENTLHSTTRLAHLSYLLYVAIMSVVVYLTLTIFISSHVILRFYEIFQVTSFLLFLGTKSIASTPMPLNPKSLTTSWLTQVLHETASIPEKCQVSSFTGQTLTGGCHFKVQKLNLKFTKEPVNPPTQLVVKLLWWEKPIYEKLFLFIKKQLGSLDREVMYLNSYEIESRFYTHFNQVIQGVKIPHLYFNHENTLGNKFGMILQDLSFMETGQPDGFSFQDSKLCLEKLAKFHIMHWNSEKFPKSLKMWDIGGYWTGTKREGNKKEVREAWDKVLENFPGYFQSGKNLGGRLYEKLDAIQDMFVSMSPKTLVHGDYKVSNVFIDKRSRDHEVYAIDWQWFGEGNPALDVMYFIATSVQGDQLEMQSDLLKAYHSALLSNGVTEYSFKTFYKQFQLCFVDFFVYTIVAKWSNMLPKDFEKYQRKQKDGLHLRSFKHMKHIVECSEQFLNELDL